MIVVVGVCVGDIVAVAGVIVAPRVRVDYVLKIDADVVVIADVKVAL